MSEQFIIMGLSLTVIILWCLFLFYYFSYQQLKERSQFRIKSVEENPQ